MGKDYSTNTYRKSYENEYVKEYANPRKKRNELEEQRKSYESVTKQETVYEKNETKPKIRKTEIPVQEQKPLVPPPFDAEKNKTQRVRNKNDYSYIDKNSLLHPVVSVAGGKYRNIYTDEIVSLPEARKILEYAGYAPKTPIETKNIIIITLILSLFPVTIFGPIVWAVYGWTIKSKHVVVMEKQLNMSKLTYELPANDYDKEIFVKKGNIVIITAIIAGIVQLMPFSIMSLFK